MTNETKEGKKRKERIEAEKTKRGSHQIGIRDKNE